jgi:hypothetical protein
MWAELTALKDDGMVLFRLSQFPFFSLLFFFTFLAFYTSMGLGEVGVSSTFCWHVHFLSGVPVFVAVCSFPRTSWA